MMFNVHLAMWGYIPLVFVLFAMMEKRKAMLTSVLIGVLFLPMWGYKVQGLPQYDKVSAAHMVPLLAAFIFDWQRVSLFRFKWFDLPIILFCLAPGCSSMSNGLGVYDALSCIMSQVSQWGPCYFLGRIYCNDLEGVKALAMTYFIGGLVYMPLCLWEIRMSPGLHLFFYGFYQHDILQQFRGDGFRPMVFMQHGLAVGIWMACATMTGFVLWRTKAVTQIRGIPMSWLVGAMIVTTILCKSTGSIAIMAFGMAGFLLMQLGKKRIIILLMLLMPPTYMVSRLTGLLPKESATLWVSDNVSEERSNSLLARMIQEDLFGAKAMQQPIFGWGGWGRSWPVDEQGKSITRGLDSLWVIYLGEDGFFGIGTLTLTLLLPAGLMLWRASSKLWVHPVTAPAAAMSIVLIMYMIDNLFNAMLNPLLLVSAGSVAGWVMQTAAAPALARTAPPKPRMKKVSAPRGVAPGPMVPE